jgi:prepilin-type N-terminal cleavage/methylation domain-containing protein
MTRSPAFTLIELMITMAIAGIIGGAVVTGAISSSNKKTSQGANVRLEALFLQARDYAKAGKKVSCGTLGGWGVTITGGNTVDLREYCGDITIITPAYVSYSTYVAPSGTTFSSSTPPVIIFMPLGLGVYNLLPGNSTTINTRDSTGATVDTVTVSGVGNIRRGS